MERFERLERATVFVGMDHVEIHVDQTAMQVLVGLSGSGMLAIFPECSLLTLSLVVLLGSAAGDELHAFRDNVCACVFDQ